MPGLHRASRSSHHFVLRRCRRPCLCDLSGSCTAAWSCGEHNEWRIIMVEACGMVTNGPRLRNMMVGASMSRQTFFGSASDLISTFSTRPRLRDQQTEAVVQPNIALAEAILSNARRLALQAIIDHMTSEELQARFRQLTDPLTLRCSPTHRTGASSPIVFSTTSSPSTDNSLTYSFSAISTA